MAGVALLQTLVSMCLGLVSVPILVHSLGRDAYGVWLLMGQAISYLALVDFGNASIAKLKLASSESDVNTSDKQRILTTTLLGVIVTTPLVALAGAVIIAWVCQTYETESLRATTIKWSAACLVGSFLLLRFYSLPTFALFGANMEYRSAFSRVLISVTNGILDIVAALTGFGMIGLAFNRLLTQAATGINLQRAAKRYVPWYGYRAFDWSGLGPMLRQNAFCVFAQWGSTMVEAVDMLVVGIAVGADAVPVYAITCTLPKLLFMMFNQAMSGANAGMVSLFASGDRGRFHFVREKQEIITLACLATVGAVTLAANQRFVNLWVGSTYYGGNVLTALGIVWYFAVITSRQYCHALSAAFDFRRTALVQVAGGLLGLMAGVAGGMSAGIVGAVAGLAVVRLATNVVNALRLDDLLGVNSRQHLTALAIPAAVAFTCCFGGWTIGRLPLPPGWIAATTTAAAAALLAGSVVWVFGMPAAAKHDLVIRLKRLRCRMPSRSVG